MIGGHADKNADGDVLGEVVIESPSPEDRFERLYNVQL